MSKEWSVKSIKNYMSGRLEAYAYLRPLHNESLNTYSRINSLGVEISLPLHLGGKNPK